MSINQDKKCCSQGHEEIMSNYYCPECKIYICNKCENFHSKLFKAHKLYKIDIDINEIFTGFCEENNHLEKLEYFCKTHNKLCCSSCIVKIKREGKGQHTDCEICVIEDIKEKKNEIFKQNIIILEELSKSIDNSIKELKILFKKINENKEKLKIKISKIFTEIRNKINEREDIILSEVDKLYDNTYIQEKQVKEVDKLPQKIKISLEKGKCAEKGWTNDNKLSSSIHECINIENSISYINQTNDTIKKVKNEMNTKIKFYPENEKDINTILYDIINFGNLYKENSLNDFNENDIINIQIKSLMGNETSPDCFSFSLNGFTEEEYNKFYPQNIKYEENEIVFTICLEPKEIDSLEPLSNILNKGLLQKGLNNKSQFESLSYSIRKDEDKIFLDLKIKINGINEINLKNEFCDISINFKSIFNLKELLQLDTSGFFSKTFDEFFTYLFSFILSINLKPKILEKLLSFIEKNEYPDGLIELMRYINIFYIFKKTRVEINFSPKLLIEDIKKQGKDIYLDGDMKVFKEEINSFLIDIEKKLFENIYDYLKLEKFFIIILFPKYRFGYSLDINTSGLTNVVNNFKVNNFNNKYPKIGKIEFENIIGIEINDEINNDINEMNNQEKEKTVRIISKIDN